MRRTFRFAGIYTRLFSLLVLLVFLNCGRNPVPQNRPYYYVYYLDGFPFGYVSVSDIGRRADAAGSFRLTRYSALFRLFGEGNGDYRFNVVVAFRGNGSVAYVSYDDALFSADVRIGESSAYYTSVRDGRVISAGSILKPVFFRVRDTFLPIPINLDFDIYPYRVVAVDLDTGDAEVISCRSSADGNTCMEYYGYAAILSSTDGEFDRFVGSDRISFKILPGKPDYPLVAYRHEVPAIPLPVVAEEGSLVVVPLSLRLSSPVEPAYFGDSFSGECLGGRATGKFVLETVSGQNPTNSRGGEDPYGGPVYAGETGGGLYCCGLTLEGGNLLRPVYWRERPGEREPTAGILLLARTEEPVRILSLDITGTPSVVSGTGFNIGKPRYSISPKKPLEYKVSYDGDEIGSFKVTEYNRQDRKDAVFLAEGELFGSDFSSTSGVLLTAEDGSALLPLSLTVRRPEEFVAVGAALFGNRTIPQSFYLPIYGREGLAEFKFTSLTYYPVGLTTEACYVYDYGRGKVAFDRSGVPARIEQGRFVAVLTSAPEITSIDRFSVPAGPYAAVAENPIIETDVPESGDQ
jgi:hypothetical protein